MLTYAHGRCVIVRCAKAFACLVNSGFSGVFCIIFRVRRGFRGGGYIMPLPCAAMSQSDICIRLDTHAEILRRGVKRRLPGRAVFSVRA